MRKEKAVMSFHHTFRGMGCAAAVIAAVTALPAAAAEKEPAMSPGVQKVPNDPKVFRPDPSYVDKPYDADRQVEIYRADLCLRAKKE